MPSPIFTAFIGGWVLPEERQILLELAKRDDMSVSRKIRELIQQEAERRVQKGGGHEAA
jgi:hypothetical protein